MEEEVKTNVTEEPKIKKRNKGWIIALVLIGLLILASIILLLVLVKPNPKLVFQKAINKAGNKTTEMIDNNLINIEDGFIWKGKLDIDSNIEGIELLNDLNLDYDIGANIKEDNLSFKFDLNEKSESFKGSFYFQDQAIYLDSKDLYDSPLYLEKLEEPLKLKDIFGSVNNSDASYLTNAFIKYIEDGINHADYKSGKHTLLIGGKKVKVTDNMLIINEENIGKISKVIMEDLRKDDKALEIISNSASVSKEEIIRGIDESLKDVGNTSGTEEMTFHIYTKGFAKEYVGMRLSISNEEIFTIINTDEEFGIAIENMLFNAVKVGHNKYDLALQSGGEKLLSGTYIKKGDMSYDLSLAIGNSKIDINVVNDITKNSQKSNVTLNADMDGNYIKFNFDNDIDYSKTPDKYDTKDVKKIDSLNEEEKAKIEENLNKKLGSSSISEFVNIFSSGLNSESDTSNLPAYYDYYETTY